jgi:malate dehydrogenase (oxaloacetate-decarboxylating)
MKLAAANGIASVVSDDELSEDYIVPSVFNRGVSQAVAAAVAEEAERQGVARDSRHVTAEHRVPPARQR